MTANGTAAPSSIPAVPEPSGAALFLSGIALFASSRCRRRTFATYGAIAERFFHSKC
jgi:hypothetical protein